MRPRRASLDVTTAASAVRARPPRSRSVPGKPPPATHGALGPRTPTASDLYRSAAASKRPTLIARASIACPSSPAPSRRGLRGKGASRCQTPAACEVKREQAIRGPARKAYRAWDDRTSPERGNRPSAVRPSGSFTAGSRARRESLRVLSGRRAGAAGRQTCSSRPVSSVTAGIGRCNADDSRERSRPDLGGLRGGWLPSRGPRRCQVGDWWEGA